MKIATFDTTFEINYAIDARIDNFSEMFNNETIKYSVIYYKFKSCQIPNHTSVMIILHINYII